MSDTMDHSHHPVLLQRHQHVDSVRTASVLQPGFLCRNAGDGNVQYAWAITSDRVEGMACVVGQPLGSRIYAGRIAGSPILLSQASLVYPSVSSCAPSPRPCFSHPRSPRLPQDCFLSSHYDQVFGAGGSDDQVLWPHTSNPSGATSSLHSRGA